MCFGVLKSTDLLLPYPPLPGKKGHVFFAFFCALRGSVFLWDHFFDSEGTFSGRKSALRDQNRLKGARPKSNI